ncbi:MAG: CoA transferase [Porticoccaceae bacterium]
MYEPVRMLQGLTLVDFGSGMAPALISKYFSDNGARVIRVESAASDWARGYYAAYDAWYRDAEIKHFSDLGEAGLSELLAQADACILGGESYPDENIPLVADRISAEHAHLVVLDIAGNPRDTSGYDRPSSDLLAQARTGLCFEQYTDKPIVMAFEPASYGAALQGICGLLAALYERHASGQGQLVATSLFEGTLTWVVQLWGQYEHSRRETTPQPKDLHPLIFRCADGIYIHIVLGSSGSKYKLYKVLGIDDPSVTPEDSGMPDPGNTDRRNFFGDIDLLAEYVAKFEGKPLLEALWAEGLPVEEVFAPALCWDNPQVKYNGIIRELADGGRQVGNPVIARRHRAQGTPRPVASAKPLGGVKVVDFGAYVAGPLATRILADLGAEVIKVEPLKGDPSRAMLRSYASANRGKKGLAVDLKSGIEVARKVVESADIVTNNFRSGVSTRLGIDPPSLHALRADMIVLESPGYGASGPLAKQAAFDLVMQALCGHEAKGGGEGNPPFWNRTYMVDFAGGMLGAAALLTALNYRASSGNGVSLEVPLLNAGVFLLSEAIQGADGEVRGARVLNSSQTGYCANEALYQAQDGWLAIAARSGAQKEALARALGLSGMSASGEFWGDADAGKIAEAVAARSVADLCQTLEAVGVWTEPCRKAAEQEVLADPAFEARGTVQTTIHPVYGTIKDLGALVTFSRSRAGTDRYIHQLGEHSDEILTENAFTAGDIAGLRERGIIV